MDFFDSLMRLLPTLEALALVLVVTLAVATATRHRKGDVGQVALALVFSLGLVWVISRGVSMGLPDQSTYDARYPVLIAAVFFLGWRMSLAVLVAGLVARAARGGLAATPAMVTMVLAWLGSVLIAKLYRVDAEDAHRSEQLKAIAAASALAAVLPFFSPLLRQGLDVAVDRLLRFGPAWALMQVLGVVLFMGGWLMMRHREVQQRMLSESRARLASLLEALPEVMLVHTFEGKLVQVQGPQDERSALIRDSFKSELPATASASHTELIQRAIRERRLVTGRLQLERKGEVLHLEVRVVPLSSDQSLSLVHDATQTQQRLDDLRSRTAHLQGVLESTQGLWATVENEGRLTPLNARWEQVTGYGSAELSALSWTALWDEMPAQDLFKAVRDVRAGRSPRHQVEGTLRRKDGSRLWTELLLTRLSGLESSQDNQVLVYVSDVTSRKSLQSQQELADKVLQSLPDGVVVMRAADGVVEWVNDGFTRVTGYEEAEVVGLNLQRVLGSVVPRNVSQPSLSAQWQGRWKGEFFSRRKDGTWFPEEREVHGFDDGLGKDPRQVAILRDLTRERQGTRVAQDATRRDELTLLPNRTRFVERLREAIQLLPEQPDPKVSLGVAVFCLDLAHFGNINKSLGRGVGDLLLQHVALGLGTLVPSSQALSRVEADEFAWMAPHLSAQDDEAAAQRVLAFFKSSVTLEGHEVFVDANVGIGLARSRSQTAESVLHQAHLALEEVVQQGSSHVGHYSEAISANGQRGLALETGLRKALTEAPQELYLEYQPKVSLGTGQVLGFEALCRWQSAALGKVGPFEFIPVAEQSGLIRPLGLHVFETACAQQAAWKRAGLEPRPIAVNLSVQQLLEPSLVTTLVTLAQKHSVSPELLELEVTESALMRNADEAIALLRELRSKGFRISLDDFGTGYSSMAYLQRLPLDVLKLDRSFVRPLGSDSESEVICKAILALARELSLFTVAEGVETEAQREFLQVNGCGALQGYLFSPPVPAEAAIQFLQ